MDFGKYVLNFTRIIHLSDDDHAVIRNVVVNTY